jgi:uncharacterized membrane protein
MNLLAFKILWVQFDQPGWLILIPILWAVAVWIGRQSLSGLGTTTRRVALAVRLLVIALIVCAVARPNWRREAENVAVTVVNDRSKSVILAEQLQENPSVAERYIDAASAKARPKNLVAWVTAAVDAYVQMLPGRPGERPQTQHIGATDGTNLEEAVQLALAAMKDNVANVIVLFSDANETSGSVLRVAQAAKAQGVPIHVFPISYRYEKEVIVERIVAPATARMGENINLRVLLNARHDAVGRLNLLVNGQPLDLDPESDDTGVYVRLEGGKVNPIAIPLTLQHAGPQQFEAIFEPKADESGQVGDTIKENNRAMSVTFVSSEGRLLVVGADPAEASQFLEAMTESRLDAQFVTTEEMPSSLIELGAYDGIVLIDTPNNLFSQQQQENLKSYVHDLGGGLVMIGGPSSFGAGGWIGSPLADALPIKLDPPQKRQLPRGALVLIMHSCEMPEGNYWGAQTALAAVNNLSRLDLAGVIEFTWQKGDDHWIYPLQEVGSKTAIRRAINNLSFGDAPSFDSMMRLAIPDLEKADAAMKHCIIISDGDPSPPTPSLLQRYINAKVSISCVADFPHDGANGPSYQRMQAIADATGGRIYQITTNNQLKNLPNIFIKEAQTIRRAMIWEGEPFSPTIVNPSVPTIRGITGVPPISGYVVAADREGLSQVVLRGQEEDPILAMWQYGLGKSVAFTSDATARWADAWLGWEHYRAFWEQQVRWAMRPGGSADTRVYTETEGDRTKVIVEALDAEGELMSSMSWRGRVVGPEGSSEELTLRQVSPGRYEGDFKSDRAGAYVMNLRYRAPGTKENGDPNEGAVQAAVTRPFADEFRALQDNSALLRQVAEMTGGKVLDGTDPRQVDLWSREGLTMPVDLRPIWILIAVLGIGTFLVDVAVRRVRIDIPAMWLAVTRAFGASRQAAGQQMTSLKEARERARAGMTRPGGKEGQEPRGQAQPGAAQTSREAARAKFEATAEELAGAKENVGLPGTGQPPEIRVKTEKDAKAKDARAEEEGMSRLLKAKKRARDEMKDE